ncbi:MAG: XdhC family protein [Boseongicola sp.]
MSSLSPSAVSGLDPIEAIASSQDDAVLAIINGVEGPSYRPIGATMAIFASGARAGTLSSGCIESDITLHALQVLNSGTPATVIYGRGSPFIDIQLPCGGGLEILLIPRPNQDVLREVTSRRAARQPCAIQIDTESGEINVADDGETGPLGEIFVVRFDPGVRFLVFGRGPEACTFAALVQSAGYPNILISPDQETLEIGATSGCETRHIRRPEFPYDLAADPWTAIILFFHDHDWEPPILQGALNTHAFYVGAQGSQRARDARLLELKAMGVSHGDLSRLYGPVGLIPSARDAGTLSVSVLAEVLSKAMLIRT